MCCQGSTILRMMCFVGGEKDKGQKRPGQREGRGDMSMLELREHKRVISTSTLLRRSYAS